MTNTSDTCWAVHIRITISVWSLCVALTQHTSAAEITHTHEQGVISYQGDVKSGDAKVLEGLLSSKHKATRLDLNSAGGEVQEALKIMRLVRDARIETHVPQGAICFSSCAFVFISGASKGMYYQSELGFHAPWLMLGDEEHATGSDIKGAFTAGQKLIRDLLATKVIPFELILDFLDKGPSELYFIDTVGKARSLGIEVYGFYDPVIDRWQLGPETDREYFPMPSEAAALWILINEISTIVKSEGVTVPPEADDLVRGFFEALNETASFTEFFDAIAGLLEVTELDGGNFFSSLANEVTSKYREGFLMMKTPSKVFSIEVSRTKWGAYDADDYKISFKRDAFNRLPGEEFPEQTDMDAGTIRFTASGAIYYYPSAQRLNDLRKSSRYANADYVYIDPYGLTAFPGSLRLKFIKDYQLETYGKPLP